MPALGRPVRPGVRAARQAQHGRSGPRRLELFRRRDHRRRITAQAAERECTRRRAGSPPAGATSYVGGCAASGWQYTTFLAHVGLDRGALPEVRTGRETDQARWVRVAHFRYLNLHPGFAVAWVIFRHAVEALAASETTSQTRTAI